MTLSFLFSFIILFSFLSLLSLRVHVFVEISRYNHGLSCCSDLSCHSYISLQSFNIPPSNRPWAHFLMHRSITTESKWDHYHYDHHRHENPHPSLRAPHSTFYSGGFPGYPADLLAELFTYIVSVLPYTMGYAKG